MRWQQMSRTCCRALTVVVPTLLLVSCGENDGNSDRADGTAVSREAPDIEGLTCYANQRTASFFDYYQFNGGGEESPEAAAQAWANDDEVVVDESGDSGTIVWVLRSDGTAHTKLSLRHFADGTWIVDSQDSCADRVSPAKNANAP